MDLSKVRKAWLVKVPNSVAAAWKPVCAAAMNGCGVEEDSPTNQLGVVTVTHGVGLPIMALSTTDKDGQAQAYDLKSLDGVPNSVSLSLAYKTSGQADITAEMSQGFTVEHHVAASFNATPQVQADKIDKAYAALNKKRHIQASTKTRTVQSYQDSRDDNIKRILQTKQANLDTKRKAEADRKAQQDAKRVKADAEVLERELFALFERHPRWTLAKLVEETGQAPPHLRAVLEKIAVRSKAGQFRDTWELKRDYQLAGQDTGTGH